MHAAATRTDPPRGTRSVYAGLALASAAFIAIGSLVPFNFQPRSWGDATNAFQQAMTATSASISKSDTLANVLLGIPLGFSLLGIVGHGTRSGMVLKAAVLLPLCLSFSAAVEFTQLYAPGRSCSRIDILAQTAGAAGGMLAWILWGRWLTHQAYLLATGAAPASRFLLAYLFLLGFIQVLPFDINSSPVDAYRRFRDGEVNRVPFAEFRSLADDGLRRRIATLLQLAGLYLPLGLLASRLHGRFWSRENSVPVFLAAFGVALFMELGQIMVRSRSASATDVVVGGAAAFAGWLIGHRLRGRLKSPSILLLGAVWGVALLWVSWQPFRDGGEEFDWIPGMPLQGGNPLFALEAMLTKLVLFGLLGAIVVARERHSRSLATPCFIGLLASAILEAGQTYFAGHTPGITDVMLGGIGGLAGAWVATRVQTRSTP